MAQKREAGLFWSCVASVFAKSCEKRGMKCSRVGRETIQKQNDSTDNAAQNSACKESGRRIGALSSGTGTSAGSTYSTTTSPKAPPAGSGRDRFIRLRQLRNRSLSAFSTVYRHCLEYAACLTKPLSTDYSAGLRAGRPYRGLYFVGLRSWKTLQRTVFCWLKIWKTFQGTVFCWLKS